MRRWGPLAGNDQRPGSWGISEIFALPVYVRKFQEPLHRLRWFNCGWLFLLILEESTQSAVDNVRWVVVTMQDEFEPFKFNSPFTVFATNSPSSLSQSVDEANLVLSRSQTRPVKIHTGERLLAVDSCLVLADSASNTNVEKWELLVLFMFDCETNVRMLVI